MLYHCPRSAERALARCLAARTSGSRPAGSVVRPSAAGRASGCVDGCGAEEIEHEPGDEFRVVGDGHVAEAVEPSELRVGNEREEAGEIGMLIRGSAVPCMISTGGARHRHVEAARIRHAGSDLTIRTRARSPASNSW